MTWLAGDARYVLRGCWLCLYRACVLICLQEAQSVSFCQNNRQFWELKQILFLDICMFSFTLLNQLWGKISISKIFCQFSNSLKFLSLFLLATDLSSLPSDIFVADDLRLGVLRRGDDAHGRSPLRHGPLRGRVQSKSSPVRCHDCSRNADQQDGPGPAEGERTENKDGTIKEQVVPHLVI